MAKIGSVPIFFVNNVMGTYGGYGPNRALTGPAAKAAAAAAGVKKVEKGAAGKVAAAQDKDKDQDKDAPRRRPRAKIIEVRSNKVQTKAISILKD